jgi:hypothetical protein
MANAFGGVGLVETIENKINAKNVRDASLGDNNMDAAEEFDLSQFIRSEQEPFSTMVTNSNVSSFSDFGNELEENYETTRNLSIRAYSNSSSEFIVYDRDFDEATQIHFTDMPAGRYERENVDGVVEGYTDILDDGSLRHFDRRGNVVEMDNGLDNDDQHDYENENGRNKFAR